MYKMQIAKIERVIPIANADKVHTAIVLGEQVIVSKEWKEGFVGVFCQHDLRLSEQFCFENNLNRDSELNKDKSKKGFFDANRRVRCQSFLKTRSEGYFTSLDSLMFTGVNMSELVLGQRFDVLNGVKLCEKYVSEETKARLNNIAKATSKAKSVVGFNQHTETAQIKYSFDSIPKGALLSFHAKVHGTSARYGRHKVSVRLPLYKRVLNKIIPNLFSEYEYDYVVGTRRVVLKNVTEGFHGSEQFRYDVLETLKPFLENDMTIYGEISGYANGNTIMATHNTELLKDKEFTKKYGKVMTYKYNCKSDEYRFHVYRISRNVNGIEIDYTPMQIEEFCKQKELLCHLNVHEPIVYDGNKEALAELVDRLTERKECLTEDYIDPTHISEGIIVRVDNGGLVPKFYKSKSYAFRLLEGIVKENSVDLEDIS